MISSINPRSMLIRGGRIIDPGQHIDFRGDVLIKDGIIAGLDFEKKIPDSVDCDVIDARNMVVSPGFIDLHCHLRDPGFVEKETIATGTRAAARGGFTTICCMPNTDPATDSREVVRYIQDKASTEGKVRVLPVGCITRERKGDQLTDFRDLADCGVIGFSDDGDPVRDNAIMRQALLNAKELDLPVIDHCEDPIGGEPQGEVRMVARDIELARETGGWIHIAHVSTRESVALIEESRKKGVRITTEVTPHHLTLTKNEVESKGTLAKVNPPLRTKADCEAMVGALKEGMIDVIATDHAPHTSDDKRKEFSAAPAGISGFETAFGGLMQLVHAGHLTLQELIYRLTASPAALLGRRHGTLGSLIVGSLADITVLAPDLNWTVDTDAFASKGKNTPLAGKTLKGKVMATIVSGTLVHEDDSMRMRANLRAGLGAL